MKEHKHEGVLWNAIKGSETMKDELIKRLMNKWMLDICEGNTKECLEEALIQS